MSTIARKYYVVQIDDFTGRFNDIVYVSESYTDAENQVDILLKRNDSFFYTVWAVI